MVSMSTCGEGRRGLRFKQKKKGGVQIPYAAPHLHFLPPRPSQPPLLIKRGRAQIAEVRLQV